MRRPLTWVVGGLAALAGLWLLVWRGPPVGVGQRGSWARVDPHHSSQDSRSPGDAGPNDPNDAHVTNHDALTRGGGEPRARDIYGAGGVGGAAGAAGSSPAVGSDTPVLLDALPESVREHPWQATFYCPADFNKDDRVDDEDARLFFAVYASREGPMSAWLDLDGDGEVTSADVSAFLGSYADGSCDPAGRARLREEVSRILAAHHQESPTVTLADGLMHVEGNGFSLTADLGPGGGITSMTMVEVSLARLELVPVIEARGTLELRAESQAARFQEALSAISGLSGR